MVTTLARALVVVTRAAAVINEFMAAASGRFVRLHIAGPGP
jgi:hypothetical protein